MIGIIGAMDVEINYLKNIMKNITEKKIAKRAFYCGTINNSEVVLVCAGIGKVNAGITTALLLDNFDIDYVINIGVAGGIMPAESLDLIISSELVYNDFDTTVFKDKYGQIPGYDPTFKASKELIEKTKKIALKENIKFKEGIISTGDIFVTSIEQIKKICKEYNVLASEMEGCAIAHTCYEFNKPFIVLRTISDVLGANNQVDNYQKALKQAVLIASKVVIGLL